MIRHFVRWFLQLAAGIVILLALLVGVARLLLPEVASFSADIKAAVRNNTGFSLNFDLLSAGMSLYGPELRMTLADVSWPDGTRILRAEQIAVSIDVLELITSGRLVPRRVLLRGSNVDIELDTTGQLLVQGRPLTAYTRGDESFDPDLLPNLRLHFADLKFRFRDQNEARPSLDGQITELIAQLNDRLVEVVGELQPGPLLGRQISLRGEFPVALLIAARDVAVDVPWDVSLSVQDYRLDAWLALLRAENLPIINSSGSADAAFEFIGGGMTALSADLDLENIELPQQADAASVIVDALQGKISWRKVAGGWQAEAEQLSLRRAGAQWPATDLSLGLTEADGKQVFEISADFLRLDDLGPFVKALGDERISEFGLVGEPRGDVRNLSASFTRTVDAFQSFILSAEFENLGYRSAEQGVDISGLSGTIVADQAGGNLGLDTRDAVFAVDDWFRERLPVKRLEGIAIWRASEQGYRVLANRLEVETDEGNGAASIELTTDADFGNPVIDLRATASLREINNADRYLPKKIPAKVLDWLDGAIGSGAVPKATFLLSGPLQAFPYRDGDGEFLIKADFENASLRYAPGWPDITDASGTLVFDGPGMYSRKNRVTIAGIEIENARAEIADFKEGVVMLNGKADTSLPAVLGFLRQSPVRRFTGPIIDEIRASGPASGEISLSLPVRDMSGWSLQGYMDTRKADISLNGLDFGFSDAQGRITIENTRVTVRDAKATLFNAPVSLAVMPLPTADGAGGVHRAEVSGVFDIPTLTDALNIPLRNYLAGSVMASGVAVLRPADAEQDEPFTLNIESDLVGVSSDLPYPLNKSALDAEALALQLAFPESGTIRLQGRLERDVNWNLLLKSSGDGWDVDRGVIGQAVADLELPAESGLLVAGYIDTLKLEDWLDLDIAGSRATEVAATESRWQDAFRLADLQIGDLFALGFRFTDVDTVIRFEPSSWDIDITGPWAEGNIQVPYDLESDIPVLLSMQRLLLIEAEPDAERGDAGAEVDPRELPAIKAEIADFAIDRMRLGQLSADIAKVPDGLQSRRLVTTAPSFTTTSSADWLVVDNAQRSRLRMELSSQDVADTWRRMGQEAGISGATGTVTANLLWEGGPSLALIYESTGELEFAIRDGKISSVETGGGRLIGMFSLAYLPRRLSLDFKDITSDGLEFYSMSGAFRLDFGNAWTCNMELISEIADVAMIGRAGLLAEDYEQLAVVRPHVSSMLPIPAVVLGGPTVGMATLLISQLFKKPLSDIGETYYSIEGSWDDPAFTRQTRSQIDTAAFADCEQGLPDLSPEEIAALEEFLGSESMATEDVDALPETVPQESGS